MSEIKSINFRLPDNSDEGNTAELPTLKLTDIVQDAADSGAKDKAGAQAVAWIAEMESEIESLRSRWQEVDEALQRSAQRTSELEQQVAERDQAARDIEADLQAARSENERLAANLAGMQQRDAEHDTTLHELDRSLQSQTAVVEMLRSDLAKRDAELQAAKAELVASGERLQAKQRNLELRERKIEQLESRIAEQDRHIVKLLDERVDMHEEAQKLRGELKLKQSMIDAFDKSARRLTDLNQSMKRRSTHRHADDPLVIEAAHLFELASGSDVSDGSEEPSGFPALSDGVQRMMIAGTGDERQFYPLIKNEMTIGRARGCDICIKDETISRVHARVTLGEAGPEIADVGSTNGILVNSEHVKSAHLKHGDTIDLAGSLKLTYVEVRAPGGSD